MSMMHSQQYEMGFKHLPLVARCRERRNLLKEATGYRYDFATAHLEYFVGLKGVGKSLKKFIDEDLVYIPDVTEAGEEEKNTKADSESLNFTSDSEDSDDDNGSHLHLSDDDESEDTGYPGGHSASFFNMNQAPHYRGQPMPGYQPYHSRYYPHAHFMKRTAPAMKTVIHEASTTGYLYEGGFGTRQQSQSDPPPPPPPPPQPEEGSTWGFSDIFHDSYGYGNYRPMDGYGGATSVPDLAEVRKREEIPDLEEVSENEGYADQLLDKRNKGKRSNHSSDPQASNCAPSRKRSCESSKSHKTSKHSSHSHEKTNGGSFKHRSDHSHEKIHFEQEHEAGRGSDQGERFSEHYDEKTESVHSNDNFSSTNVKNPEHLEQTSFAATRDLREVVAEIRDEFSTASEYGIEVALMLEVGKLPHKQSVFHEIFSRVMLKPTRRFLAAKASSLAKSYLGDVWMEIEKKPYNLSSTLDSLYVWEKKLYKEVKAEEKLRLAYEKQFKLVQRLVENGAESTLIDEARASLRKLETRLNVCVKPIITISTEIHRLRDEKLLPQTSELINGLITMWNLVLRCHQKQFRAIMDSKMETLKANTFGVKPSSRASRELDMELRAWSSRLNDWISTQKSFVQSLNAYLMLCLEYNPEEITPDRPAYYSPGRLEAPAMFLICNDWSQAMETVSNTGVADAIHSFTSSLHELSKRQDEEQRQRAKARDFIPKKVRKRLVKHELERGKTWRELDTMPDDTLLSHVLSEENMLKVNFDLLWKKFAEERAKHKDAVERMHDAASSAQGGLIPLFKALESFSSKAVKVHQQIRLIPS